jgi:3-oxoacyl-[acyl-carrier protein] reductase
VTQAFLPSLRGQGRARIINIASIGGRRGTPLLGAYCAAKHGVVGLTRALAEELRPDRIAVNAICPGSVDTAMLTQGLPGAKPDMTPTEVAQVVLFLAADAPATMTGQCLDIFG